MKVERPFSWDALTPLGGRLTETGIDKSLTGRYLNASFYTERAGVFGPTPSSGALEMRVVIVLGVLFCLGLSGCAGDQVLQNGGHGVPLLETDKEQRAGAYQ
jgi:hypothetical protein